MSLGFMYIYRSEAETRSETERAKERERKKNAEPEMNVTMDCRVLMLVILVFCREQPDKFQIKITKTLNRSGFGGKNRFDISI